MASPAVTYTFSNSTTADATQVNTNFSDLIAAMTDGTKDFSISALTLAGNLTANGNVTLGNATSDDVTVTGSLASTIPIKTTNTYDIGSSTKGLAGAYFGANSQTVRIVGSGSMSATWTFTLPVSAGTADHVLKTDGSGVSSWTSLSKIAYAATIDTSDTNVSLTVASARHTIFNSFTASRDVTLPTTSVVAGEIWVIENTTAYDMVVKASGGNALTRANSCNLDATVQKGYVVLEALQATPTTPAHWRVLDVVEHYLDSTTTVNNIGTNNGQSTILTRMKNLVTASFTDQPGNSSKTNTTAPTLSSSLPLRFRPSASNGIIQPWYIRNNGSDQLGYCVITTGGSVTWNIETGGAWTSGAACLVYDGTVTYATSMA